MAVARTQIGEQAWVDCRLDVQLKRHMQVTAGSGTDAGNGAQTRRALFAGLNQCGAENPARKARSSLDSKGDFTNGAGCLWSWDLAPRLDRFRS